MTEKEWQKCWFKTNKNMHVFMQEHNFDWCYMHMNTCIDHYLLFQQVRINTGLGVLPTPTVFSSSLTECHYCYWCRSVHIHLRHRPTSGSGSSLTRLRLECKPHQHHTLPIMVPAHTQTYWNEYSYSMVCYWLFHDGRYQSSP